MPGIVNFLRRWFISDKSVPGEVAISAKIEYGPSVSELKSSKLLREATAKKRSGDLEGAILTLQAAYSESQREGIAHTLSTYLRLPLYFQEAGRADDAWTEFNRLLSIGFPGQARTRELLPMHNSEIYDKMRLFLQREGRPLPAVTFCVFSSLEWARGLYFQNRMEELESMSQAKFIHNYLRPLLKKIRKETCLLQATEVVQRAVKNLPDMDFARVGKEINDIIANDAIVT